MSSKRSQKAEQPDDREIDVANEEAYYELEMRRLASAWRWHGS